MARRVTFGLLMGLAALVAISSVSWAHADLLNARPPAFSELDRAPATLLLHFSEQLEDRYTSVEVVDANGTDHVRSYAIVGNRDDIEVQLEPLADGVYTVRWRTLSVDTHTSTGQYLLAVNVTFAQAGVDPTAPSPGPAHPPEGGLFDVGARSLSFAGAALAAGIPLVLLALANHPLPERRQRWALGVALVGATLAALATLGVAASLGARIDAGLASVFETRTGGWLLWRVSFHGFSAIALLFALTRAFHKVRSELIGGAGALAVAALAATSRSGHAAAQGPGWTLPVLADWAHLVAAAFWIGGLTLIGVLLWRREVAPETPDVVRSFSPMAIAAVGVLVVTGSYGGFVHLERWSDLWSSTYGLALTAKVLLLAPLVALGAYNRYLILPRLGTGLRGKALGRLRKAVASEVLLMALVLLAAGVLTATAPPQATPDGWPSDGAGPDALTGVVHRFNASGFGFALAVHPSPPRVGLQHVVVEVDLGNGSLPENAAIIVGLKSPRDPGGEGEAYELTRIENTTRWEVDGPLLTEAGTWRATLVLQGRGTFVQDRFEIEVAAAS